MLLGLGMLCISSSAIFVRLCDDAPPVIIATARLGIATLVLLLGLGVTRGKAMLRIPARLTGHIILGGLLLAGHFYFWMTSLRHTSVLSSVVIVTTNPIFVGIGSLVFFRERIHRNLLLGIILAAGGGVLISLSGVGAGAGEPGAAQAAASIESVSTMPAEGSSSMYGNMLALLGAITASGYLLIGRKVRASVDVFSYMVAVYGLAAILLCGMAIAGGHSFSGYRTSTYLYFIILAIAPQIIGHGSLNYALKHLSATMVAVCILAEPIGATILAYIILGESADRWQAIGATLILFGIFIATQSAPQPANRSGASAG